MTKVVLITGASRGIGRATARLLGARGWSVGVNYAHNQAAAQETAGEVGRAGGHARVIPGDVSQEADVIAMFDALTHAFGRIDALVNNAGIVAPSMQLADMDVARLKRLFDVNVLGAYLCAREAARRMSKDRGGEGGAIVNVSSAAVAPRLAERVCRLCRLERRRRHADHRSRQGTRSAGRTRECGTAGADRHRDPRKRRPS